MKVFLHSSFITFLLSSTFSITSHSFNPVCRALLDADWKDVLYGEIDLSTRQANESFWINHVGLTEKDAPLDDPNLDRLQSWNGHFYPAFYIEDTEATVASAGWYAQGCLPPETLTKLFTPDQRKQIETARVQIGRIIERYAHYRQNIQTYFEEYYTLLARLEIAQKSKILFERWRKNKEQSLEITYPVYKNGKLQEETIRYARPAKFFADLKITKTRLKQLHGSFWKQWSNRSLEQIQRKQAEDRGRLQVILEELEFRKKQYDQNFPDQFTEQGKKAILYVRALLESVDVSFLNLRDEDSLPRFSAGTQQNIYEELKSLKRDYEEKLKTSRAQWEEQKNRLVRLWSRWRLRHQMLWYESKVAELESLINRDIVDFNELFLGTLSGLEDPYRPTRAGLSCLGSSLHPRTSPTCESSAFDPARFPTIDLLVRHLYDRRVSIESLLDRQLETTRLTGPQVLVIQSKLQILKERFEGEKHFAHIPRPDLDTRIAQISGLQHKLGELSTSEMDEDLFNEIWDLLEGEELLPTEYYQNWLKAQITALEGKYKWRYFMQRKGRLEKKTGNLFPLYTLLTNDMIRRFGIHQVSPLAKLTALFHGSALTVLLTGGISFYPFFIDMAQSFFVTQWEIAHTLDEKEYERRLERYIDGPFWSTYRDFKYWVLSWVYDPLELQEKFIPISPSLEKAKDLRHISELHREALEEARRLNGRTNTYGKWSTIADRVNQMGMMAQMSASPLKDHFIRFEKRRLPAARFEAIQPLLIQFLSDPSDTATREALQKQDPSVIEDYHDTLALREKLRHARSDHDKEEILNLFVLDQILKTDQVLEPR